MKPSIFNYVVNNLIQEKSNEDSNDSKAYQLSFIHNSDKKDIDIENELKGITKTWSRCTVKCNK
jgi:hypothetical protein